MRGEAHTHHSRDNRQNKKPRDLARESQLQQRQKAAAAAAATAAGTAASVFRSSSRNNSITSTNIAQNNNSSSSISSSEVASQKTGDSMSIPFELPDDAGAKAPLPGKMSFLRPSSSSTAAAATAVTAAAAAAAAAFMHQEADCLLEGLGSTAAEALCTGAPLQQEGLPLLSQRDERKK
ncbi:hypothetical protein ACSSS7_000569 [Eimeria intestinalis]